MSKKLVKLAVGTLAVALVSSGFSCAPDDQDPHTGEPIVVTNAHNEVIDMPAGVRWDVDMTSLPVEVRTQLCVVEWGGAHVGDRCIDVEF